ncbi:MAG: DNA primase, partial [Candidatus Acidiferrales bacterium]
DAVRTVAEKCGIAIPRVTERSPEEGRQNQQRTTLVEIHREAAAFFARQLHQGPEGKVAMAYLEERGLDRDSLLRFGLGYAPGSGDALLRQFKSKYNEKALDASGLFSRDQGGRMYDRFRRRILFPIASDSGKIIAFGGRSMGDDMPKYLNSPETPIYSKSNVLYHLDRAKEAIRQSDFAILVEGYMDAIAVARAGFANVVASCGTSLAEAQIKLLGRFTRRIVVNYDADAAGQSAAERSLALLLEKEFDVRVLSLPGGADPDQYLKQNGAEGYRKLLGAAPTYLDYLIGRARQMNRSTAAGKLAAVNYLMPYVQRIPNALLRSEWASRISAELRVDEPVLRESIRRAAAERRGDVKPKPELLAPALGPAERRLIQMLAEPNAIRERLAGEIAENQLHCGLETEKVFARLIAAAASNRPVDAAELTDGLAETDRRMVFEALFEASRDADWDEAESCLAVLRQRTVARELVEELVELQKKIDSKLPLDEIMKLQARRQELQRKLVGR